MLFIRQAMFACAVLTIASVVPACGGDGDDGLNGKNGAAGKDGVAGNAGKDGTPGTAGKDGKAETPGGNTNPAATKDLVAALVADGGFTILSAALTKAGLNEALKGAGPFTVLAPNDAAFAKAGLEPYSTVAKIEAITAAADIAALKSIMQYHVLTGVKADSAAVALRTSAATLAGNGVASGFLHVQINVTGAGATAEIRLYPTKDRTKDAAAVVSSDPGSKVVKADLKATNGVIHGIDTVIIPPSKDIVDMAKAYPALSSFAASVTANNLVATLHGAGPLTVFAPTNTATLWPAGGAGLPNLEANASILKQHVTNVTGAASTNFLTMTDIVKLTTVATKTIPSLLAGKPINVGGTAAAPTLRGSSDVATLFAGGGTSDIITRNGIVHVTAQALRP